MSDPLVESLQPFASSVFAEMSALAMRTGAVNLGQGYPDTEGPAFLVESACRALRAGHNQYSPRAGVPELRRAVAEHQQRFYGLDIDADSEVLVTVGATEGIAASILAFVRPGDEVVTFEPYYDSYPAMVARAGGVTKTVRLRFPDFDFDESELAAAFTDRTRLVLLNTPHNPTGKMFRRDELALIARLAEAHDALIVTDEVYEHLVLSDTPHVPMATLPEATPRTITLSSAGKTFSMTGWKVGWATGPAELVAAVTSAKQWLTFSGPSAFQYAVAEGLGMPDGGYAHLADELRRRKAQLVDGLNTLGIHTNSPQGAYFAIADLSHLGVTNGVADMESFVDRFGVVGIPVSAFETTDAAAHLVRFTFCKRESVIDEALNRLRRGLHDTAG